MLDSLNTVRDVLIARFGWLSPDLAGVVILTLAVLVGIVLHGVLHGLIARLLRARAPYLASLLAAAASVTRFALVIVLMMLALPLAPFTPEATAIIAKALLVAII